MRSVQCKVWSVECRVQSVECDCLCLCLSLYGREMTVSYARLRWSMGAALCHLAALRSASEFLFWDHWETAVLGQLLAGRSGEVTGANFCHLAAPQPPIEFLFCDHWDMAVLGQILAGEVTGGREVTGGYRGGKRRKVEERQEKGLKKRKNMKENR